MRDLEEKACDWARSYLTAIKGGELLKNTENGEVYSVERFIEDCRDALEYVDRNEGFFGGRLREDTVERFPEKYRPILRNSI